MNRWTRPRLHRLHLEPHVRPDEWETLAGECDAFLTGHYVEWLEREGLPVPAWARLNRAAHGAPPELRASAAAAVLPPRARTWEEAETLVVAAVVAGVAPEHLEGVQRQVLVPLELGLTGRVLSPGGLVDKVCAAIYQPAEADSDTSRC